MENIDKPVSLSMKAWIIRNMSVKNSIQENVIETVINHQFESALAALETCNSLEFSGFGKIFFNVNKAYKDILKNKSHAEINIEEIDYKGYGLANKYSRYFHDNSLNSFDKILVARQIKKELERKCELSIIGEDTIENFKKIFGLVNEVFKSKDES